MGGPKAERHDSVRETVASATGQRFWADPLGFTVTVTSCIDSSWPSLAIARSRYVPGALKLTFVVRSTGLPYTAGALSGSKVTLTGPLYWIHLIRSPWVLRLRLLGSGFAGAAAAVAIAAFGVRRGGFGSPSSVAETFRVRGLGSVIVCARLPSTTGAWLPSSSTPPPLFSEYTP